ncbi:hypothetical protein QJQ45_000652 [Haematococcus lacustris]|nr:hypothetical protein QJQ45_000652 [Haematococcus lacustris]
MHHILRRADPGPDPGPDPDLRAVEDLPHLELALEKAGSAVVVLFFTSRACGVCKEAGRVFEAMCRDARCAQARVLFLRVHLLNEYDQWSEVARWHRVRSAPTFLFLDEGAVIRRLALRDVRRLAGSSARIQSALAEDMRRLREVFLQVLLERAPSTRN